MSVCAFLSFWHAIHLANAQTILRTPEMSIARPFGVQSILVARRCLAWSELTPAPFAWQALHFMTLVCFRVAGAALSDMDGAFARHSMGRTLESDLILSDFDISSTTISPASPWTITHPLCVVCFHIFHIFHSISPPHLILFFQKNGCGDENQTITVQQHLSNLDLPFLS